MKLYKEFIVSSNPFIPDLLSGLLWELNISGIEEEEKFLILYADENSGVDVSSISKILSSLITQNIIENFSTNEKTIEEKNWNEEWEKNQQVLKISDGIIVKPSNKEYKSETGQIVIAIDPKMTFGTGEHQSTKLILHSLEKIIKGGEKILDVGTGTGILSIISIKLGAEYALGVDIGEWCIENAKENILNNDVNDKVEIRLSELKDIVEKNFDIIAANIGRNTLLDIAEQVKLHLKKNGILILSGLLADDEEKMNSKYKSLGFDLLEINKMDEWISLLFKLT